MEMSLFIHHCGKLWLPKWKARICNPSDCPAAAAGGGANSRLAHWEPSEKSLRWFKSYLQLAANTLNSEQMGNLSALGRTDLGSPVTVTVWRQDLQGTVSVNLDYMYSVEELDFLNRNFSSFSQVRCIVEVGAGFGRTAHTLLTLGPAIERYRIVDLPETLLLSSAYLLEVLPREDFEKLEFLDATRQYPKNKESDLFIQIDGFQEMKESTIATYYSTFIGATRAAYLCNPIGKYPPRLAGVEGLDEEGYQAARQLGRSTLEIDPWDEVSLSSVRQLHDEVYRPHNFKLIQSAASFLRPLYSHGLYLRNI